MACCGTKHFYKVLRKNPPKAQRHNCSTPCNKWFHVFWPLFSLGRGARGPSKASGMARGAHWLGPCHPGHLFGLASSLGGGCMLVGLPLVSRLPRGWAGWPGMHVLGPGCAAVPANGTNYPCRRPWAQPWLGCWAAEGARKLACQPC